MVDAVVGWLAGWSVTNPNGVGCTDIVVVLVKCCATQSAMAW